MQSGAIVLVFITAYVSPFLGYQLGEIGTYNNINKMKILVALCAAMLSLAMAFPQLNL